MSDTTSIFDPPDAYNEESYWIRGIRIQLIAPLKGSDLAQAMAAGDTTADYYKIRAVLKAGDDTAVAEKLLHKIGKRLVSPPRPKSTTDATDTSDDGSKHLLRSGTRLLYNDHTTNKSTLKKADTITIIPRFEDKELHFKLQKAILDRQKREEEKATLK